MSNKKGMTLIEIIVALAIFGILIVMTTGVFSTAIFISNNATEMNNNSHNAQHKVNDKDTTIPQVESELQLEFDDGKIVVDQINQNKYESNGLEYENFETK